MNSRQSYFLISGIIILSVFIGAFIWSTKHLKEVPQFNTESFTAPISSKYIPKNNDLVLHWKINPNVLPDYIGSFQDKVNKQIWNKQIRFIIDSSFKLISLDFSKDISKWIGNYGSFAVFNSEDKPLSDWLIVLGIKNDINIEEELESIFAINKMYEYSNKLSDSKSKIISKEINSNRSIYFATEKENVLIASNPKIIESSIFQLDDNILNTKEKYKNIQLKDNLNDGIILLEISPKEVLNQIGQQDKILELDKTNKLISSINIDKNKLKIEGILSYEDKTTTPINDQNYNSIEMNKEFELFDDFISLNNSKQYFGKPPNHPYQNFIASIIKHSTNTDYSKLFKTILDNCKGNLIWINKKGSLVITNKDDTNKKEINDIFKKEKFLNSNLDFNNRNLEVWSKISTNENNKYEIKDNIEAIIEEDEGTYIWSKNLSSITNFDHSNYLKTNLDYEHKIDDFDDFDNILRIHLGKEKTETFLNSFYPYILFKTMLGNKLNFPDNIDISISVPKINYLDFVKFKINLKTS